MNSVETGVPVVREIDPLWVQMRTEVAAIVRQEPMLASYLHATVLKHRTLESALSFLLSGKLESPYLTALSLHDILRRAFRASPEVREAIRADLGAVVDRDPAAGTPAQLLSGQDGGAGARASGRGVTGARSGRSLIVGH